jgi:hypothetical protein
MQHLLPEILICIVVIIVLLLTFRYFSLKKQKHIRFFVQNKILCYVYSLNKIGYFVKKLV